MELKSGVQQVVTHSAGTRSAACTCWRGAEAATGRTGWSSSPGTASGCSPPETLEEEQNQPSTCVVRSRGTWRLNSRVLALPDSGSLGPVLYEAITLTLYSVPLSTLTSSMELTPSPTKVSRAGPGAAEETGWESGMERVSVTSRKKV